MMEAKFGRIEGTGKYVQISDDTNNAHIFISGQSGAGKSFASAEIIRAYAKEGGAICAINVNDSFTPPKDYKIRWVDVKKQGLPVSLLSNSGNGENQNDIVQGVVDIFRSVKRLGVRQQKALREAIQRSLQRDNFQEDELAVIGCELLRPQDDIADSVFAHFEALFNMVQMRSDCSFKVFEPGMITVFDLTGYNSEFQCQVTEWILTILWNKIRKEGAGQNLSRFLMLDEFQNLNLKPGSVLSQVLREGRKYGLALILATQTLETFSKAERILLQQSATQLYFRPAASEVRKLLSYIGFKPDDKLGKRLLRLQRGECIAVGRFKIGSCTVERPIKISFRSDLKNSI